MALTRARSMLVRYSSILSKRVMSSLERDRLGQHPVEESMPPSLLSGLERLTLARFNKGLAFTLDERQLLGVHGILPPRVKTQDEQVAQCVEMLNRMTDPLNKYIYVMSLLERNERLFFRLIADHVEDLLPIVYTPTVGAACENFSLLYTRPHGLFVTIYDKGHVYDVLKNWPVTDVRAIVVTDGERILGLGDLGANGMGIPIGKLSLYTALGGIKPHQCLPVTIDVGTNNETNLKDPHYVGLRQRRVTGAAYDELLDEFMAAAVRRFGQDTLIQFEDFGNSNAFRLLHKYRDHYCTFNDDIQGTASVALAGLLASLRVTNTKLSDHRIVFQGAGEAAIGIAGLCVMAMQKEGLTREQALERVWMVDSKGLIVKNRAGGGITEHKAAFAKDHKAIATLAEVVQTVRPTILIGAAAIGGAFTRPIIEQMAKNAVRPVIFALSNPTSKAECTAEQAYEWTEGRAIFASGSPFPPYTYRGKTLYPGQGNNSYIFPGVALGAICVALKTISEEVFLHAAEALATLVSQEDLDSGCLYPPLNTIQHCSLKIATQVAEEAYQNGSASVLPEPKDKEAFIKAQMYSHEYSSALPARFSYPKL